MRHLFVANDFPPKHGGIESFIVNLCAGFDPADVCVVAPAREGHESVDARLPYEVVRLGGNYMRATHRVAQQLVDAINARAPDVIHVMQVLPLGRLVPKLRSQTGIPVCVHTYGSEVFVPSKAPGVRRVIKRVLEAADVVISISRFTREAIERLAPDASVAIVEPAVDARRFSLEVSGTPVRSRLDLGAETVTLFVSRLVKRKGADVLVRAMEYAPGVAVVAGTGPEEQALRRLASELRLTDRVLFTGSVPDGSLPAYYAAADIFCMPCADRYQGLDTEGYGIVYLEASASGLPCIAGRCGGSVEAVVDGVTGVLLRDSTPGALAKAISRLAADEVLRARLGGAGRRKVEQRHTPKVAAETLTAHLERVLADA